ncbi:FtsW/RodA/SpoVE family cell cycle protein [soil metagenome]
MEALLKKLEGDKWIWAIILVLSLISLLAVYSSTGTLAYKYQEGNTEYYLFKHTMLLMLGLFLMYVAHLIPYRYYAKVAQIALYISIPLLAYTLLFGSDINDAKRWITLPIINFSFQTSDLAKLALIMFLARTLTVKQANIKDFGSAFVPLILPVFLVCALILPANLSTAAVLFATCVVVMFIGRVSWKHIFGLIALSMVSGALFVTLLFALPQETLGKIGRAQTWKARLEAQFADNQEVSYQVAQSNIAIAKGGIIGQGPGKSMQRNFLPHPYSDFIYAIIIEEYGLIGGAFVMFLYLGFLYRCIKIVAKSPKAFGAFLAVGLGLSLVFQAIIHMAVSVNLLPVTGLTLPFVSMGGTSMFFTSIAVGIILSVSRSVEQETAADINPEETEEKQTKTDVKLATA